MPPRPAPPKSSAADPKSSVRILQEKVQKPGVQPEAVEPPLRSQRKTPWGLLISVAVLVGGLVIGLVQALQTTEQPSKPQLPPPAAARSGPAGERQPGEPRAARPAAIFPSSHGIQLAGPDGHMGDRYKLVAIRNEQGDLEYVDPKDPRAVEYVKEARSQSTDSVAIPQRPASAGPVEMEIPVAATPAATP